MVGERCFYIPSVSASKLVANNLNIYFSKADLIVNPTDHNYWARIYLLQIFCFCLGYGKGKVIPLQAQCGPEGGYRYSFSSTTTALEGGEWSAARPSRTLPPGKTRYPFYRRLGGPQGWSGQAINLVPTRIRSQTV